jgi:hypothetical protein
MAKTGGIAGALICGAGTLLTAPTGVLTFGVTRNESLKVTPYKPISIKRDEIELPNMVNLNLTAESLQPSLYMFKKLIDYKNGNCDVQITTLNGSVFQFFAASNPIGIEPTFILNDDYRVIKVELEAAFPKTVYEALELAAQSNVAVASGLTPASGRDTTKKREPYPLLTESPSTVSLFTAYTKRSLEISALRKDKVQIDGKSSTNISIYDKLLATFIGQTSEATFADRYNQEGKGLMPELLLKDGNAGVYYDIIKFNANTLAQKVEYNDGEEKADLTVTYKGAVALELMVLETGTGKGDAVGGTGLAGGTLKFNY